MLDYFVLAYHLLREAMAERKVGEFLKTQVFRNRLVVPVEMNLLCDLPMTRIKEEFDIHFIEYRWDEFLAGKWQFPVPSRRVKVMRNIPRGLRGFALVHNCRVVGDLWCICRCENQPPISHPDFAMLDINCKEREAYAFDAYIDPAYRGKNLAAPLQRSLQLALKNEGYSKVYGAFYEDNRPALWMHRMLKFKEYPKRRVFRFFSYLRSSLATSTEVPSDLSNVKT